MNENFITKIFIDNVRHLNNIEIPVSNEKSKHLILTGKNGSGKTSVLEALKAYLSLYLEDINTQENINLFRQEISTLQVKYSDSVPSSIEKVKNVNQIEEFQKLTKNFYKGLRAEIKNLDDMRVKALDGKFVIAYYNAERIYKAKNETQITKVDIKERYNIQDKPGDDFVKYILNLKATEAMAEKNKKPQRAAEINEWFQRFDQILKKIFQNDNVKLDFDFEEFAFHIYEPNRNLFSFSELSSGYAAVLDIITDLMMRMEEKTKSDFNLPGIVMVDEIETHLHIELQKQILPILSELFSNIQFIITTHSPFILNSIDEVVIYDLEDRTLINGEAGLSNIPYEGVVEGYFNSTTLSDKLRNKFYRYKELANKENLTDEDYAEIIDLESYLDEIPDFLALEIIADYQKLKLELNNREGAKLG